MALTFGRSHPGQVGRWIVLGARRRLSILFAGALLVVSACTGTSEPEAPEPIAPQALQGISPFQARILEDGVVGPEEWESAVLAMVACLEDRGVPVEDFEIRGGGWSIAYASVDEHDAGGDRIYDDCYQERLSAVEPYYLASFDPPAEAIEAGRRAMVECLQREGIEISDDAAESDFQSVLDTDPGVWFMCRQEESEAFRKAGG